MTNAISQAAPSRTVSLEDFKNQNTPKPQAQVQNPYATVPQDTYVNSNQTYPIRRLDRKKVLLAILGAIGITALINSAMSGKKQPQMQTPKVPPQNITGEGKKIEIWEDLTNAKTIDEMAMPETLETTLRKVKTAIEQPKGIKERGGKPVKSILLYGPPGTGKTTFAKAIAKFFPDSEFASVDITSLNSKYHGETEKNVDGAISAICKAAKENPDKKYFVFIDEIDSVMMVDDSSNSKLSNDVLNVFKKCFSEKLGKYDNIITIGATNLNINDTKSFTAGNKKLDKPMLDRFEEKILVDLPTPKQIMQAMNAHYQKCSLVEEVLKNDKDKRLSKICDFLAKKDHKFSFRSLESLYKETAALYNDDKTKVGINDIITAIGNKIEEFNIPKKEWDEFLKTLNA